MYREQIEQELRNEGPFMDKTRAMYQDERWRDYFRARTVAEFRDYVKENPVPEDPIIQSIFENNVSATANEELIFQTAFDLRVFPSMRYNLGCIHSHSYFEVSYLAKGTCTQIVNGVEMITQPGDFLILAPGASHYIQILDDDSIVISVAIRKSTFQKTFFGLFSDQDILSAFFSRALNEHTSNQYLLFRAGNDSVVKDQLYDMYFECQHPIAYSRQSLNNKMSNLFIYLLRYHQEHVMVGSDSPNANTHLFPVLQYIQYHFATVTLQELSERFHYHPSYIGKSIKDETGQSFNELRQKLRLSRAVDMMKYSDLPLQQIALELGYSDLSHFYRSFKAQYGVTPNQYRKRETE